MSVIYVLVPLAVLLAAGFVAAYAWAARSGQLDDLVTPALRVLTEDDEPRKGAEPRSRSTAAGAGGSRDDVPPAPVADGGRR